MHVVQVIDHLRLGGAQKMLTSLTRELLERRVDVTVISLDNDTNAHFAIELKKIGVEVISLPANGLLNPVRFLRLLRLFRQNRYDLVQTYLIYSNIVGVLAGSMAGLPVIASLRSTGVNQVISHPLRSKMETWTLRYLARCVMANGYAIAEAHQPRIGRRKPIHVIPNAVPIPPLLNETQRRDIRTSLIGKRDGPLLISVGRFSSAKGYPDLLNAFSKVARVRPDISLVIVGDGRLSNKSLHLEVQSLGIESQVFMVGERDDVPALLSASDLYVNASHREGMSVALLEAMASGLPVIATTVGDAQKMLVDGTGLLVPPKQPERLAEAINSVLANPSRMELMGRRAREHANAHYGLDMWVQSYLSLYRETMNRK